MDADATLHNLILFAAPFTRLGRRDEVLTTQFLRNSLETLMRTLPSPPPESLAELPMLPIRASHELADVFDKLGDYVNARNALRWWGFVGPLLSISEMQKHRALLSSETHTSILEQCCWLGWAQSVSHHRFGEFDQAMGLTKQLLRIADEIAPNGWHHLKIMLNYAYGRHLQTSGKPAAEVEVCFTRALEHCSAQSALAMSDKKYLEQEPNMVEYVRAQTGVIVMQLARLALETGQLERAWRQMQIADVFFNASPDEINCAFMVLMKGCVRRQKQDLRTAIELLSEAADRFKRLSHSRYLYRTLQELAKAHFNRAETLGTAPAERLKQLNEARTVLGRLEELTRANGEFGGDPRTRGRWEANRLILSARINLAQGDTSRASAEVQDALKELKSLEGSSQDLHTLLTAVWGEILLKEQNWAKAIEICELLREKRPENESIDKTDLAWVLVVLWDACVKGRYLVKAKECRKKWESQFGDIENEYIRAKAEAVKERHDELDRGFFVDVDKDDLNYERLVQELKVFLVHTVEVQCSNETIEVQAKKLGVKRQTLANWKTEMRRSGPQ